MINELKDPEIIIGIVGAVGSDLGMVSRLINEELKILDYSTEEITLSQLLEDINLEYDEFKCLKDKHEDESNRISKFMDAGDRFRSLLKGGSAIALLAIAAVRESRKTKTLDTDIPSKRTAYILRSLKRPEEISFLKKVYGEIFIVFSIYSPQEERLHRLSQNICKSKNDRHSPEYDQLAKQLIERDEKSGHKTFGQNVQDAFPFGDLFIEVGDEKIIREQLNRFFISLFGYPFNTPSKNEYGMFFADTVAKRSSDLSRQVGAAILSYDGEIIATGCNDVPKFGGGIPWSDENNDFRDFKLGQDLNASMKDSLVKEVFDSLKSKGWLSKEQSEKDTLELVQEALYKEDSPLKGKRLTSLLEFSRCLHAEMNALMDAAKRGVSVKNAVLYCTTFPCHMCAKLIIASGIKQVYFIEPYPKSLTKDLYSDLVSIGENDCNNNKVKFSPFVGISPNMYRKIFSQSKRKDENGYAITWEEVEKYPRFNIFAEAYTDLEIVAVKVLQDFLEKELAKTETVEL